MPEVTTALNILFNPQFLLLQLYHSYRIIGYNPSGQETLKKEMKLAIVKYKEWEFEVDRELTISTYKQVSLGGADTCTCNVCKNYVAYRHNVFPDEIKNLFIDLGVEYKKEVEIVSYDLPLNGLHNIMGCFILKGKFFRVKTVAFHYPEVEMVLLTT